jgi:hypothetical protein
MQHLKRTLMNRIEDGMGGYINTEITTIDIAGEIISDSGFLLSNQISQFSEPNTLLLVTRDLVYLTDIITITYFSKDIKYKVMDIRKVLCEFYVTLIRVGNSTDYNF